MPSKSARGLRPERKVVTHIIMAFEGFRTEPNYFHSLKEKRLFPESKLTLEPLPRDEFKKNDSNPEKVLRFLKFNRRWIESEDGSCPVDLFFTKYLRTVVNRFPELKGTFYSSRNFDGTKSRWDFPCIYECKDRFYSLLKDKGLINFNSVIIKDVLEPLNKYMEDAFPGYDFDRHIGEEAFEKPYDMGCNHYAMVVDRDQESFHKNQVEDVSAVCDKEGFLLIISNPNFELWLSMHFKKYSKDVMMEYLHEFADLKYKQGKKNAEIGRDIGPISYLRKFRPDYKKGETFWWLEQSMVERAIANSTELCTEISELKKEISTEDLSPVGTNMRDLFNLMISGYISR